MHAPPRAARCRGFTLIEVLVVMTIIGLAISGVTIGLESLRGRDDALALERLRWVLEATAERARIRGQAIAFEPLADGYRFSLLDADGRWIVFEDAPVFVARTLPASLRWNGLTVNGRDSDRIVFGSQAPRFLLQLHRGTDGSAHLEGRHNGTVTLVSAGAGA